MLENLDGNEIGDVERAFARKEALASYKLKTVLKHLNMSTFDYDIQMDTMYVRKEYIQLPDFTEYRFKDGGEYYYLENVMECLPKLVRSTFYERGKADMDKLRSAAIGEMIAFDAPIVYKEGNTRWTSFIFAIVDEENGVPTHAVGYCKDIHLEKKELFRLRNVAQTDYMTGLRNRASGVNKIHIRLLEEKDKVHVFAVIDLNKFKSANDLYGHAFGDEVLKSVAARLKDFTGSETVVSRTGGDEFMFFSACDSIEHGTEILCKLEEHLNHTVTLDEITFEVTASVGFSVYPNQGTEFDELYHKADIAMYQAKQKGIRTPVIYEETMSMEARNE